MCNANGLNSPTDPRAIIETRARRAIYDRADPREKKWACARAGRNAAWGRRPSPPLRSPQGTQPPPCAFSLAHPGGGVKGFGKIFLDFFSVRWFACFALTLEAVWLVVCLVSSLAGSFFLVGCLSVCFALIFEAVCLVGCFASSYRLHCCPLNILFSNVVPRAHNISALFSPVKCPF